MNGTVVGNNNTLPVAYVCIPNTATSISGMAFTGVTNTEANLNIQKIRIGLNVNLIGESAFRGCFNLNSVTFEPGSKLTIISLGAFTGCTGLTSITIPDSVTTISLGAFTGCTGLTSINIPNSVTTIGNNAFQGCTGLTEITIPNSVTTIGQSAFIECTGLTSIDVNTGNQHFSSMGGVLYDRNQTTLIKAPSAGINGSFVIPDSVTNIGHQAFQGCTSLTSITIPNSVMTIGQSAFQNCTGLTNIVIPDSVTTIGNFAFSGCNGLTTVTFESATPPAFEGTSVFTSTHSTLRIYVPAASVAAYRDVAELNSWRNRIHSVGCSLDNAAIGNTCNCP
jgi:hypothetical protein